MDELVAATTGGEVEFVLTRSTASAPLVPADETTQVEAVYGRVKASIDGRAIWCGDDEATGFEWTWIELLEFLGDCWRYIALEDGAPLGVAPSTVPRMLAAVDFEIERAGPVEGDFDIDQLEAFRETHDLAEAFGGAVLPPLWVVREGNLGWVTSDDHFAAAPFNDILAMLEQVGDFVAKAVDNADDPRSQHAIRTWLNRSKCDRLSVIEAATGYSSELIAEIESAFYGADERTWDNLESDELLAAARLVGPQPPTTLRSILAAVRDVGSHPSFELDALSDEASKIVTELQDQPPYAQGHGLATWLRKQRQLVEPSGRVDPEQFLASLAVPVMTSRFGLADIDAIGCWGPRHGPTVLLNLDGPSASSTGRRRATLAHELCHLLVDRVGALPLAEVLGGRSPKYVEQRAGTFAAELLLPRHIAGHEFVRYGDDHEAAIRSLRARYLVSTELLAWQIRNSDVILGPEAWRCLASLVPNPSRFRM